MWPWLRPHSWLSLSRSNCEIAMFQEWEGRLTLNKRDGGLSFMTMTVTFWWPRWSVRIYQTATGVTLDVDVLLTRLVRFQPWSVDFPHFGSILTLSKTGQIWVSRHFLGNECWSIPSPSELIRFWSWSVNFPNFCDVHSMAPCPSDRRLAVKGCCRY